MKNIITIAYLYKWIHIPSKMWYIGSKTSDGCHPSKHESYICSKSSVKKSIKENRQEWYCQILILGDKSYIRKLETKYLKKLDAKNDPKSFNESNASWDPGNRLGRKESELTRKRKSIARQGDKNPMFGKTGKNSPHYGKKHSDETKKKQSIGIIKYNKLGRPKSHNENISKALTGNPKLVGRMIGELNPNYGKSASDYNKSMTKLKNSGKGNPMMKPEHQKLCEHCNKIIAKNHYTMFHGDKCKSINHTV